MTITFNGKTYPTKSFNGYVFATEPLGEAIAESNFKGDAEVVDNQVAYFFDEETFNNKTAQELFEEYDLHS